MEIDFKEAFELFQSLPEEKRVPCFNPQYLLTDSRREGSAKACFFSFRSSKNFFVLPLLITPILDTDYFDAQAPYGYCGPIFSTDDPDFVQLAWRKYLLWCEQKRVVAEFQRFHPLAQNWEFYPGSVSFNRSTVWVDLTQDVGFEFQQRVRTSIRRAEKELSVAVVRLRDVKEEFKNLYFQLMRSLETKEFYFFNNDYFDALAEHPHHFVAMAIRGGEMVGGAIFLIESGVTEYHLSASNDIGKRFSATALILRTAIAHAKQLGSRKMHLGGGSTPDPENRLYFFKCGFSQARSNFYVGANIMNSNAYEEIRSEWLRKRGVVNENVLFYR